MQSPDASRYFLHLGKSKYLFSKTDTSLTDSAPASRSTVLTYTGMPGDFLPTFKQRSVIYIHVKNCQSDLCFSQTLRQTKLASTLHHAGWTNTDFPVKAASTVVESISRYEGFLKLIANPKYGRLGPSKEIDLVWHTHQLTTNYRYLRA